MRGRAGEEGAASVLTVVLTCALIAIAWMSATSVAVVVAHREAQTAADLAALAAAADLGEADHGCGAAAAVASANKARLVSCDIEGQSVSVEVEVKVPSRLADVRARARAGRQ